MAGLTVGANGKNALPLDTIDHEDPSGFVIAVAGPIVITHDGLYLATATTQRTSTTVSSVWYLTLEVNAATVASQRQLVGSVNGVASAALSQLLYLAVGDTVQPFYTNTSGVPTLTAGLTRFALARVGPKQWT